MDIVCARQVDAPSSLSEVTELDRLVREKAGAGSTGTHDGWHAN